MKNNLLTKHALLLAAVGTGFLVGCTTPNGDYSNRDMGQNYAQSQITVTPVTQASELAKWTQFSSSLKAVPMLLSIESYQFSPSGSTSDSSFSTSMEPGSVFHEAAGSSGNSGMRLHTPGQR